MRHGGQSSRTLSVSHLLRRGSCFRAAHAVQRGPSSNPERMTATTLSPHSTPDAHTGRDGSLPRHHRHGSLTEAAPAGLAGESASPLPHNK